TNATYSPMPGAAATLQHLGVDTFSIVANAKPKRLSFISNFGLDLTSMSVSIRVPQNLERDPAELVLGGWTQGSAFALLDQFKFWRFAVSIFRMRQFVTGGHQQFGKTCVCSRFRTQALDRIPALRESLFCISDGDVQRSHRILGLSRHQVTNCLKLEH